MKRIITTAAIATALTVASSTIALLTACTADVHDNTANVHDNTANINNAKVQLSTTSDLNNMQPNQVIQVTVAAQDVFLIEPNQTPPADRVMVAGHFQFYFDSLSTSPILITASENVSITVPSDMQGAHKLICRIHKHDGTPTSATFTLDLKVTGTVVTPMPSATATTPMPSATATTP
ncbi:MAG TPA: hypothetical protein VL137_05280 [Polyangiaceae bacterium]|nr:hypothetical protein [Polyangiaceae bacterium]